MGSTVARLTRTAAALVLLLWAGSSSAGDALRLVSSVDGASATDAWKYVKRGQKVKLSVVLAPAKRTRLPPKITSVRWFKVAPTAASLDNTSPSFHFEAIPYEEIELEACRGKSECDADVSNPKLPAPKGLEGTGTMAFKATATLDDGQTLSTPGMELRVSGGLAPLVHRVTVRADDTYLGYLTELFGTPYIFGSAGEGAKNQTDLLIGSDCADLAVYGKRRMGQKLEYTSSYAIDKVAPEVVKASGKTDTGVLTFADGTPVKVGTAKGEVKPGDVVHFPGSRHVAVLYEDREPKGVLDVGDHILHTCWAAPTIEPISATSCSSLPVRILRFK